MIRGIACKDMHTNMKRMFIGLLSHNQCRLRTGTCGSSAQEIVKLLKRSQTHCVDQQSGRQHHGKSHQTRVVWLLVVVALMLGQEERDIRIKDKNME
jgi:hypothetical protein